jgi:hypothetical protein
MSDLCNCELVVHGLPCKVGSSGLLHECASISLEPWKNMDEWLASDPAAVCKSPIYQAFSFFFRTSRARSQLGAAV